MALSTTVVHHFRMARTDRQFNLRLPDELREKIEKAALKAKRSITAEVTARLEASFDPKPQERWEKEFLVEFRAGLDRLSKIPSPKR